MAYKDGKVGGETNLLTFRFNRHIISEAGNKKRNRTLQYGGAGIDIKQKHRNRKSREFLCLQFLWMSRQYHRKSIHHPEKSNHTAKYEIYARAMR